MNQLTGRNLAAANEPFTLFEAWFAEAQAQEPNDPNAMALATVDAEGTPDVRMVLLKALDARGFVFYTNSESAKGVELAGNARAALGFHWKSLRRQVRARGPVERVTDAEADAYFASRPRDSRIGAWASQQSRPMQNRFSLEAAVVHYAARFAVGDVPRPPYWTGFRVLPLQFEFWRDKPFRLHERIVYRRAAAPDDWVVDRLYP